jgi:hypothetical protein
VCVRVRRFYAVRARISVCANLKSNLYITITMTTQPQCQLCHYHVKTEDQELLCVNKNSSCYGKIVELMWKCDLFSDYMEPDSKAKIVLEDTSETNDIATALIMLRESRRVCE